jgi:hypothetical protein
MLLGFSSRPGLWFGLLSIPWLVLGLAALLAPISLYYHDLLQDWFVMFTTSFLLLFLAGHLLGIGMIGELLIRASNSTLRKILRSVSVWEV